MSKAWEGDWRARVHERVRALGYPSLVAWCETRPLVSYLDLAREIGPDDVAAAQIEHLLYEEVTKTGPGPLHRLLRSGLARYLRERLPPSGWDEKGTPARDAAIGAYADWRSEIPAPHRDHARSAWQELSRRAPRGWRPGGPDDAVLVAAFENVGLGEEKSIQD